MKLLALMAVVAVSGVAYAQDVRLMAPETGVRQQLLDERPSLFAPKALFIGGGILGTVGTTAAILGAIGMFEGGYGLAVGMICFFPGLGAIAAAIGMLHKGLMLLALRESMTPEPPPPLRIVPHPDPEARGPMHGLTTVASF